MAYVHQDHIKVKGFDTLTNYVRRKKVRLLSNKPVLIFSII